MGRSPYLGKLHHAIVASSLGDEFLISRGAIRPVRRDRMAMRSNAMRSAEKREMLAITPEDFPVILRATEAVRLPR
ncbi:hypothetical protein AOG23_23305 [Rhizobium acidisoli]|nr:hypothetical protein AOG23_23305 [Rhizobium acidisoli]